MGNLKGHQMKIKEVRRRRTPRSPRVRLQITNEIIAAARPRDSNHCMIADALKAAVPEATRVSVDLQTIRYTDPIKKLRYSYMTPRVAQVHIVKFDQGMPLEPYGFLLRGGQVTKSGASNSQPAAPKSEEKSKRKVEQGKRLSESLKKARLVARTKGGTVSDRVGGRLPPLQSGKDDVPFSRRRAYGLRALEY